MKRDKGYDKKVFKVRFELSEVRSAYSGKPNRCMCGCSGTYYYAKDHQKESSKNRGYKVTDDEVNDRTVKMIYNKMVKNANQGIEVIGNYIYTIFLGRRQYTIYLKEKSGMEPQRQVRKVQPVIPPVEKKIEKTIIEPKVLRRALEL